MRHARITCCAARVLLIALLALMLLCRSTSAQILIHNVSSYDEALSLVDNSMDRLLFLWDPLEVPSWKEYTFLQNLDVKQSVTVYAVSARSPYTSWLLAPLEVLAYPSYRAVFRNTRQTTPRFEKVDANTVSPEVFLQTLRRFAS